MNFLLVGAVLMPFVIASPPRETPRPACRSEQGCTPATRGTPTTRFLAPKPDQNIYEKKWSKDNPPPRNW